MTTTTLTADQSGDPDDAGYILASVAAAGPRERDFLIQIGSELEYVEWRGDQHARPWQVVRGYLGTAPTTHSSGATVTLEPSLAVGGVTVTDGTTTISATSLRASSVSDGGAGEAIVKPVVIADSDPGAIGAGNLWLNTTQDVFDDLTNFPLLVRNEADDGWIPVLGDAVGAINLNSYSANGVNSVALQLIATNTAMDLNANGFGPSGESGITISDHTAGQARADVRAGGAIKISLTAVGVGFNGTDGITPPVIPASPTAQNIVTALVALGLVTQAS